MFDKDNEEGDVEEVGDGGVEENSTESGPKLLDHFQGVFVNPRHRVPVGRRRQDSGDDEAGSDPAQIDWLPGRHQ